MKLLYVTSEAYPFCKTGGLADVAGSVSRYCRKIVSPPPWRRRVSRPPSSCPCTTRSAPSGGRK